jgi:LPS-assembly protein
LLLGSVNVSRRWVLDAALQYSPEINRTMRSVISARYSPEPMHTLAASYRLARAGSEYLDAGWQWPVYRGSASVGAGNSSSACQGTLYSVGRANYSMRDSRVTDSLVGFEYDSGCWIARVVGERVSTGRTEATTRLLLQLELVGLSRLGSNPLQVLKDNIPGYQLLRDDHSDPPPRVYTPSPRRQ